MQKLKRTNTFIATEKKIFENEELFSPISYK
jgi:hypothetical protein